VTAEIGFRSRCWSASGIDPVVYRNSSGPLKKLVIISVSDSFSVLDVFDGIWRPTVGLRRAVRDPRPLVRPELLAQIVSADKAVPLSRVAIQPLGGVLHPGEDDLEPGVVATSP